MEEAKERILRDLNMSEVCLNGSVETFHGWLQLQPHLPRTLGQRLF